VSKTSELANTGAVPTTKLAEFLASTRETGGFDSLVELIYNATAASNGFDKYGHFTRLLPSLTNCLEYELESSGCSAKYTGANAGTSSISEADLFSLFEEEEAGRVGGTLARPGGSATSVAPAATTSPAPPATPQLGEGHRLGASNELPASAQRALLDYLLRR